MIECYTYSPDNENTAYPDNFAVLLGTPLASEVMRDSEQGDTGVRAGELATLLGATVVAYQELGPKTRLHELWRDRQRMHPDNFAETVEEAAKDIADHLGEQGIDQVAMRIHSGNGPFGTQLALEFNKDDDKPEVTHLVISDPVGIRDTSLPRWLRSWGEYRFGVGRETPSTHLVDDVNHPSNKPPFRDALVRGRMWRSSKALDNMYEIAETMPEAAVLIRFPANTFNGDPAYMLRLTEEITERVERPADAAPFLCEYEPSGFHASVYDNHVRNATFIEETIRLAPLNSEKS